MSKKRKKSELSNIEKRRLEKFNEEIEKLKKEGYKERDLTISALKANILAFVTIIPLILILSISYYFFSRNFNIDYIFITTSSFLFIVFLSFFILIIIHELIHALAFAIFSENHFKGVSFGFIWKTLTPYCTISKPLKKFQYIMGIGMPCFVLGVIPSIIAIALGNFLLLLFSFIQILGAGGDLLIIYLILANKNEKKDVLYYDHPTEIGVVLLYK